MNLPEISPRDPRHFGRRRIQNDDARPGDVRTPYQRDRARIIHSAAFRRLQGKTQVMGVGEGDYHRTRLTHSIECAQICVGLLDTLHRSTQQLPPDVSTWLPERDLAEAACFAHDLGHPPFGHGGERALHSEMGQHGGFEGNGQTLRIIARLEKYGVKGGGIDPTRRLVLAVLKYPAPYSEFVFNPMHPPKCYFDEENSIVNWALDGLSEHDRLRFPERSVDGKTKYKTFDCSLMEIADDIAYGIHDIEDIVARRLVDRDEISHALTDAFAQIGGTLTSGLISLSASSVESALYSNSRDRKQIVSMLVNAMVTSVRVVQDSNFEHPLLSLQAKLGSPEEKLLEKLKKFAFELVVRRARVQQLEHRGQWIVSKLFQALSAQPEQLIPSNSWTEGETDATQERRVCDYVAGMTDAYAEKIYSRFYLPGFGSSSDEL
ncbi:anti-phage deoxyguanosine triphosphatase [Pararoseomonas sp. SCSIO 73927]|uniref:anti-phage deoxyguanosine triphosphatase n=1 Tax=Pararoseomonas sp. SCSIO 73927 TaxID=3114537 RepID=UPI0030CCE08F